MLNTRAAWVLAAFVVLFVPKSLLDSSPPQVNPDTRGHSSLPAGKKYKIFPCYGFLTASRKRPACPGVPGASSVVGSSPRAGATVAASPVVGRWAEPAPLPSPFCVCVSFPCRCAERNTPRSALLAKTGAAGRCFRLWFHGTLLVVWLGQSSAVIVASSSFPRTKPNVVQGQKDSSSW